MKWRIDCAYAFFRHCAALFYFNIITFVNNLNDRRYVVSRALWVWVWLKKWIFGARFIIYECKFVNFKMQFKFNSCIRNRRRQVLLMWIASSTSCNKIIIIIIIEYLMINFDEVGAIWDIKITAGAVKVLITYLPNSLSWFHRKTHSKE